MGTTLKFYTANADLSQHDRIEADQIDSLYHGTIVGLLGALAAAAVLCTFLQHQDGVSAFAVRLWLAAMVVQTAGRIGLLKAYGRFAPPPAARRIWGHAFTVGALIGGLCWGIGSLLMVTPGAFDIQLFVIIVISALVYASLSGFGIYWPFFAFLFPSLTPLTVWSAFQGDTKHFAFALMGGIWIPIVAWLGYRHDRSVKQSYALRYENLDLLESLRVQKDRAEQANIAKSRFLASASHDLRQPVHALSMFVGALRSHQMSDAARRLLHHVENSIGAMDGLFTALLDISRLDAGVIEAHPAAMALQPLLERICRDLEGEAAGKGIGLRLRPCRAVVRSDPVLLERILRNLISNAVRYTERGGVLVGCRHRGHALSIEVWDTGAGIAESNREQVFEEFYQVANPGRDRGQGLGLGLAIVRRLTRLLHHPLHMQSQPGRGSVFKVQVAQAAASELPARPGEAPAGPDNGLILVVDDEVAIQDAMRNLLESWGHGVIVAGSGPEMLEKLVDCPSRPVLIICDYRLAGEDGIAVVRRLQSEFNEDIPAMLITGDTAPERLQEAQQSGFVLLHKPLSADRLLATIRAARQAATSPATL